MRREVVNDDDDDDDDDDPSGRRMSVSPIEGGDYCNCRLSVGD